MPDAPERIAYELMVTIIENDATGKYNSERATLALYERCYATVIRGSRATP
jgi:hypothetical protein